MVSTAAPAPVAAAVERRSVMIDASNNDTAISDDGGAFAPSVWGDFFATYVPPPTQAWQLMAYSPSLLF
jgi:hypothetical protein